MPKYSYEFVGFIWDFLYHGKPYKILGEQVVFKTVDELTDQMIEQINQGHSIGKYNLDFSCKPDLRMKAAARVLSNEYRPEDLIKKLTFIERLRTCFGYVSNSNQQVIRPYKTIWRSRKREGYCKYYCSFVTRIIKKPS